MGTSTSIAQILGIATTILLPVIYACKTKPVFYGMHMLLGFLRLLQYLLLGAWTGAISGCCSTVKNGVYLGFSIKEKVAPPWVMLLFMLLSLGLSALGFHGAMSILPLLTIAITGYGNWQHNYIVMCSCNIIGLILGFAYSLMLGAYGGLLAYVVELVAAVVGILRHKIREKDAKNDT